MKILATIDKSKEGNDCFINEEYSLIEVFGQIVMIRLRYISGYSEHGVHALSYYKNEIEEDYVLREIYDDLLRRKV